MGFGVCTGAMAKCPFGVMPTPLTFLPSKIMGKTGPMGSCCDCAPFMNISPFGVCLSLLNPITAAQTAAAFGVLTPGPCIPSPIGMWIPTKPTVISSKGAILTSDSILTCAYGGVIKILPPFQFTVMI